MTPFASLPDLIDMLSYFLFQYLQYSFCYTYQSTKNSTNSYDYPNERFPF